MTTRKPRKIGCLIWIIVIPFLEAGLIILTVKWLGAFQAYSLLIGTSVAGILFAGVALFLLSKKLRQLKASLDRAKAEGVSATGGGVGVEEQKKKAMTEAVPHMVPYLFAMVLFLIPGFITDALGFWMISPLSQMWLAKILKGKMPPLKNRAPGGGSSFSYTPGEKKNKYGDPRN